MTGRPAPGTAAGRHVSQSPVLLELDRQFAGVAMLVGPALVPQVQGLRTG